MQHILLKWLSIAFRIWDTPLFDSGIHNFMFEQTFRNIIDVLWKEVGCTFELDYTEQTSWMLFLKYLEGKALPIQKNPDFFPAAWNNNHCNNQIAPCVQLSLSTIIIFSKLPCSHIKNILDYFYCSFLRVHWELSLLLLLRTCISLPTMGILKWTGLPIAKRVSWWHRILIKSWYHRVLIKIKVIRF